MKFVQLSLLLFTIFAVPCTAKADSLKKSEPVEMHGRTYHIDPLGGDDANDGLTPQRPLKTYAARKFNGGDTVLFKRGSVIRDMLHTCNGTEKAPIVYGAYGEGEKPAFLGSVAIGNADKWVEQRPCVWRYTDAIPSEVCNLVFNGGESCGNLQWKIEDLCQPGEWHYTGFGKQHQSGGDLYLYSTTNPGRAYKDIECVLWGQRRLVGAEQHVILENLSFRNSGVHGYQAFHAQGIVIRNCEFCFIGGAVWHRERQIRFGNAVEFWDGGSDITVEGCLFDNIYDSGVTHQGGGTRNIPQRIYFRNNLFIDCGLAAYECREPSQEIYFEHNTCINTGGGFSMQGKTPPRPTDPYPQPLGYHVWAWMIDPHTQPGNVYIRHNIFCKSYGPAICLSIDAADDGKFILDHNCYWQTTGAPLIYFGKGAKNWAEAIKKWETVEGPWTDWGARRSYLPAEFARYQAQCGQDAHSRIAKPLFVDEASDDYRQRADSPCLDMGMLTNSSQAAGDIRLGNTSANRILFFGNSITISPMSVADTNWTGGWGMAASVAEKDYVHLVVGSIAKATGDTPKYKATYNIEFEKNYATYDFNSPAFQEQLAFKPDIVVVAIGENVLPLTTPEEQKKYAAAFGNLLERFKNNGNPRIFVRSCYWADKVKDGIMKQAALAAGCVYVDQGALGVQANWAISEPGNPFQNAGKGVNAHPGDKSMKAIADSLFEAMATNSKKK